MQQNLISRENLSFSGPKKSPLLCVICYLVAMTQTTCSIATFFDEMLNKDDKIDYPLGPSSILCVWQYKKDQI